MRSDLRNLDIDQRNCLYREEFWKIRELPCFSNYSWQSNNEQKCAPYTFSMLSKYSQSGCTFECMIKAGFQVGTEGHIHCKPWNFPQTKTALYAGKLFFLRISFWS